MKRKTIGNFFNNLSEGEYSPLRSLFMVKGYAVLECDVSFTAVLSTSDGTVSDVWHPDDSAKDELSFRFREFAEVWCDATAANSRIREISVYSDGATANFWYFAETGRSSATAGGFPFIKPSVFIFNTDGTVLAHEFAHSALTIFDEYKETGRNISRSPDCSDPLTTHDTVDTLMGSAINSRFSYPADYPKRGGIQTAQWTCYGRSEWEVLIQSAYWDDVRAVSSGSIYPRQDYFFRIGADIPDFTRDISYSCAAPMINWIPSTITTNTVSTFSNTVAVMIDHSASMGDAQRLSVAQRAAKDAIDLFYVEERPVSVSIVGFDDVARTEVAPTPLNSVENLRMIKSAIDGLYSGMMADYSQDGIWEIKVTASKPVILREKRCMTVRDYASI